jgi:NAD+ synthetase
VLLGLSGGIDSALVAALAVAALGPKNVRGISMPGPFSSEESRADAMDSAKRLGMNPPDVLSINDAYRLMGTNISPAAEVSGITDENLQSRLRGLTLMTLSNATGALVLSTGNKSEFAVGYATLYGDMCGGMAPLGDLLKTQVFSVARWLNANPSALGFASQPIPQSSLTKPPSAELRPNQTDQDSLPEYSVLDQIVSGWVDDEKSAEEISQTTGLDRALVARWTAAIDRAQYKRNQAPIIPKLSARAFGPGRRMPLAMRYRLVDDSSVV